MGRCTPREVLHIDVTLVQWEQACGVWAGCPLNQFCSIMYLSLTIKSLKNIGSEMSLGNVIYTSVEKGSPDSGWAWGNSAYPPHACPSLFLCTCGEVSILHTGFGVLQ